MALCGSTRSFAAKTLDGLPAIGIQFMSAILSRLHFGLFHREVCRFSRQNVPRMQRRIGSHLKPCLIGYFQCLNSIFHLLFLPLCYCCVITDAPSPFRPHTRAPDESTQLLCCHSTPESSVHTGNFRHKNDTLSAKVILTFCLPRTPTLFSKATSPCTGPVGFSRRKLQITRWWSVDSSALVLFDTKLLSYTEIIEQPLTQPISAPGVLAQISVSEESVHYVLRVVTAQLQHSVIINVSITTSADHTLPYHAASFPRCALKSPERIV